VKDAVFGNVGTIIVFRVGAEDAEFLEPEFAPSILIEDFVNLGKYHVYLKLMIDGITSAPFSAHTLPPIEKLEDSQREKIIRVSRERYSVPRDVIEEKITKWAGEMTEAAAKNPPAQNKGRGMAGGMGGQSQSKMFEIICSMCGKQTKVIFEPEPGRKVYCKTCLKKIQGQGGKSGNDPAAPKGDGSAPSQPRPAAPFLNANADQGGAPAVARRTSLADLAHAQPVRFAGQKNDNQCPRPKKEVQIDELKKALNEALGAAGRIEK